MDKMHSRGGRPVGRRLLEGVPGSVRITDPERIRVLSPPPSKECLDRIEALDRMTKRGGW
jgi:hypothetical protein